MRRGYKRDRMKLTQSVIQKYFTVKHKGKTYYVDYINSDDRIMLGNRDYWQVLDEELEELSIYIFKDTTKKEKQQINKNVKLTNKLIKFCKEHFEDYKPDPKDC